MTKRKDGRSYPANIRDSKTGHRTRPVYDTAEERDLVESIFHVRQAALKKGPGEDTFAQAGDDYVNRLRAEKKHDKATRVSSVLRNHLNPVAGDIKLKLLDRTTAVGCAEQLWDAPLAVHTIKSHIQLFVQILCDGFGDAEPPVRYPRELLVGPARAEYASGSLLGKIEPIPFGPELLQRLEKATGALLMVLILCIQYGMRIGEALGLRHWDIHEDDDGKFWIQVRHTLKPDRTRNAPKTKAGDRDIPIDDTMADYFRCWQDEVGAAEEDQLISDVPGKIYSYGMMATRHDTFQRDHGMICYSFHKYRAACATAWLIANVSISNLIKWLGHADLRTTLESYANAIMFADELWKLLDAATLEAMTDEDGTPAMAPSERVEAEYFLPMAA